MIFVFIIDKLKQYHSNIIRQGFILNRLLSSAAFLLHFDNQIKGKGKERIRVVYYF